MKNEQKNEIFAQIEKIVSDGIKERKKIDNGKEIILDQIERYVSENTSVPVETEPVISVERTELLKKFSMAAKSGNIHEMEEIKKQLINLG